MKKSKRFTVTITNYHWSCGDGCCSDSGFKCEVIDNFPVKPGYSVVYDNNDWDNNRNKKYLLETAVEPLEDKNWLNRVATPKDYEVIYDNEDSDGGSWSDN